MKGTRQAFPNTPKPRTTSKKRKEAGKRWKDEKQNGGEKGKEEEARKRAEG